MKRNYFTASVLVLVLIVVLAIMPAKGKTAAMQAPDEVVRQFYKHDSAIVVRGTIDDDKRIKNYFDKSLGDLILADHHADESNQISFDPIADTNGNPAWTNLQIGAAKFAGDAATVVVTFTLKESGFKKKITYSLHKTSQGWRISDLATNEWDLKRTLKDLHPAGK